MISDRVHAGTDHVDGRHDLHGPSTTATAPLMRPYKVMVHFRGSDAPQVKKGFGARNLQHLIEQACLEFKVQLKGSKLVLQDGTEVDEDDYFALLPDDTLFVLIPPKEHESFTFWKVANDLVRKLWRLPTPPKDDLMKVIEALAADEAIRRQIQQVLDRTAMNLEDSKSDDPAWFQNLKTNIASKEAWMTKNAKERVRGYYVKSKDDVENLLFGGSSSTPKKESKNNKQQSDQSDLSKNLKLTFDRVFDAMRRKLVERNFYAAYFGRSEAASLRLCDDNGWFYCQGEYDRPHCAHVHRINPYGNRESRIMFSTWNLDHVVERSRSIVPSLAEAIREVGAKTSRHQRPRGAADLDVNWKYFHELLFVARVGYRDQDPAGRQISDDDDDANLKLVHTVCHVKTAHKNCRCDKCKYF